MNSGESSKRETDEHKKREARLDVDYGNCLLAAQKDGRTRGRRRRQGVAVSDFLVLLRFSIACCSMHSYATCSIIHLLGVLYVMVRECGCTVLYGAHDLGTRKLGYSRRNSTRPLSPSSGAIQINVVAVFQRRWCRRRGHFATEALPTCLSDPLPTPSQA